MEALRKVANGRTAKRTRLKRESRDADGWKPSEVKRLKGMQDNGIAIQAMSKMLGRSSAEVRNKLSQIVLD